MDIHQEIEIYQAFTRTYQAFSGNIASREVACMRIQYPLWLREMGENDVFVGKGEFDQAIGFSPQPNNASFGYFLNMERAAELLNAPQLKPADKEAFSALVAFWKKNDSSAKLRTQYPEQMAETLPSDDWIGESGIGFPLYRMSGTQLDYDKLLTKGIDGLKAELRQYLEIDNAESQKFYKGLEEVLELFQEVCAWYARAVTVKLSLEKDSARQLELERVSNALQVIANRPPENMFQAIQLTYLYCQLSGSNNFGRMDEYLGNFLVRDLENGVLSEETAIQMLVAFWKQIDWKQRIFDSRVIIGGLGRRNERNANRFAMLAMEATRRARTVTPQLTLRFHDSQDRQLMHKAYEVIAEGTTFPMLYNDDINIPAVQHAMDVSLSDAIQYVPFGCGEYTLYHRSVGTPSGVINMVQALLVTLNDGMDPTTGKPQGLALGDTNTFMTFEQCYHAYQQQIEHYVTQLAYQEKMEYDMIASEAPFLFFSLLYDDCLTSGKSVFGGGVRHLGGTLEAYGNTNTSNSLLAIKKLIFEEKRFSLEELKGMLNVNFEGYEKERKMLLEAPKFGNDDPDADAMRVDVDRHLCSFTREMGEKAGLDSYLIVIINNHANTLLGKNTGASPDGRCSNEYFANANNPTPGTDKNGVTAMLNSLVKPDVSIHAGAVQNMKFSKQLLHGYSVQFEALMDTYFAQGGAQAMISVMDVGELEDAMKQPENYQSLMVRVGGYSARFVELPKDVQLEILHRTMYE